MGGICTREEGETASEENKRKSSGDAAHLKWHEKRKRRLKRSKRAGGEVYEHEEGKVEEEEEERDRELNQLRWHEVGRSTMGRGKGRGKKQSGEEARLMY